MAKEKEWLDGASRWEMGGRSTDVEQIGEWLETRLKAHLGHVPDKLAGELKTLQAELYAASFRIQQFVDHVNQYLTETEID